MRRRRAWGGYVLILIRFWDEEQEEGGERSREDEG